MDFFCFTITEKSFVWKATKTFLGTMDFISKVNIKRTQFSGTMDVAILHEEFVEGDALGHQVMIMTTMMTMMVVMLMVIMIMIMND